MLISVCSMLLCMPFGFWSGYMAVLIEERLFSLIRPKTQAESRKIKGFLIFIFILLNLVYALEIATMMIPFYK